MKKKLIMMIALLSFWGVSAEAQSFEFLYQGQSLEDGATVTIVAEKNAFGELSCETNPSTNPTNGLVLKLPEGSVGTVKAVLEIQQNTLTGSNLQWCMGGVCTMFGEDTSLTKKFNAEDVIQVQFDASNIQVEGSLTAKLMVTYNFSNTSVLIKFVNGEATGLKDMDSVKGLGDVYDMNGHLIRKTADAAQMKTLPSGIYIVGNKKILNQ